MAYLGYAAGPGEPPGRYLGSLPFNTAASGAALDQIFYQNGQTVTADYTIQTNYNAISAGPISINSGVVVTIPSGSVWTIA